MNLKDTFKNVAEDKFNSLSYNRFLSNKKLMGSKCEKCRYVSVPPRPICAQCQSTDMALIEMEGEGKLAAYTVITAGTPLMVEEGYDRERAYCCGVVELEKGVKVTARILGVDVKNPGLLDRANRTHGFELGAALRTCPKYGDRASAWTGQKVGRGA